MQSLKKILVVGGGGYVGAVLVPKLLDKGYFVRAFDTFWYGENVLKSEIANPNFEILKGDIRNEEDNKKALKGMDTVIDLACISNDPSADLNPKFTHSINYDGQVLLMKMAKASSSIKRFIYASSSSVYGVKVEKNVTEDLPLEPLTQYSKLKVETERFLLPFNSDNFTVVIVRPATVCGYSPRMRLDLSVNLLTSQAITHKKITVYGGVQKRPNINIHDVVDVYCSFIEANKEKISGQIFNAGYENLTISEIAKLVKKVVGKEVVIENSPTNDLRSYHISSEKIKRVMGFNPKYTIEDAIIEIKDAFKKGLIRNNDDIYFNVKFMKANKIDY